VSEWPVVFTHILKYLCACFCALKEGAVRMFVRPFVFAVLCVCEVCKSKTKVCVRPATRNSAGC
jgi:hypothetical protein